MDQFALTFFPKCTKIHLVPDSQTLPSCQSSALLFKSSYRSFSLQFLLNRLTDSYHFFIKMISKMYLVPHSQSLPSCQSSALLFKSPYRSLTLPYLLNRLTDSYYLFIKMISKMYLTVAKHILPKTRWRRLDLDTCFPYIS